MIFGLKERFAIECELKSFISPKEPIWGDIWLWTGGERLGEEPSYIEIGLIAGILCASLLDKNRRWEETLSGKSKEEIWTTVHEAYFGKNEEETIEDICRNSDLRHRFFICGATEGFDNVFGILVEDRNGERFIWRSYAWTDGVVEPQDDNVHEVVLNPGEYESVVESFLNWLETETGFRPEIRDWVELSEDQREAIRQVLVKRKPSLARPEKRSLLDRAAREELARRRAQENAGIAGVPALDRKGSVQ